jgi:hypothetical protein
VVESPAVPIGLAGPVRGRPGMRWRPRPDEVAAPDGTATQHQRGESQLMGKAPAVREMALQRQQACAGNPRQPRPAVVRCSQGASSRCST